MTKTSMAENAMNPEMARIRNEPSLRFFPSHDLADIFPLQGLISFCADLASLGKNLVGLEIGTGYAESATVITAFPHVSFLHTCDVVNREPARIQNLEQSGKLKFHEGKSLDVCKRFTPGLFDFIYIDGAHDAKSITEDLRNWIPKVKKGGLIGGHDYNYTHHLDVCVAVNEYAQSGGLKLYKDSSWSFTKPRKYLL